MVAAQGDGDDPRITGLTVDPSGVCALGDGDTITGTVQSENLAETTAVVITASFGIGGDFIPWGDGTSIPGVPIHPDGEFSGYQPVPASGAWQIGHNSLWSRSHAGSDFRNSADTFVVQADLYDSVDGRIPRVDETTGAWLPWQVVEVDLTQCGSEPGDTDELVRELVALLIRILEDILAGRQ